MRQWRVGTLSLGLILIAVGVSLLTWLSSDQLLPVILLRWWPLALVVLGIEIVASTWPARDGHVAFKYDWVSMLLIVIIVTGCFVLSLLKGLGLTDLAL